VKFSFSFNNEIGSKVIYGLQIPKKCLTSLNSRPVLYAFKYTFLRRGTWVSADSQTGP